MSVPTYDKPARCLHGHVALCVALLFVSSQTHAHASSPATDGEVADARKLVEQAQDRRIETIGRISPAVVCVFDRQETGGGSGVIIDPRGYGITNFHVVAGMLSTRHGLGGLSDGKLYDLEVLGIDPTGDVAMFRLLGADEFPFVPLGDSDAVRVGDTAIALGNPFTLSEDYAPTVTTGLISGVHRYQWGVGSNLVYSDCIQTDASINPGNSGGPLFNERGEVIGINGRISVNTRGRFNVGHGYAISSNQIRRFIPALRAGLLAKHGTLQATVESAGSDVVVFDNVRSGFAADKAGIHIGDRLRTLGGVPIDNPNRFASVIGTYPASWTVPLTIEREGETLALHVRLDPIEPDLQQPFEPDGPTVNRAIKRVLDAYAKAVLSSERETSLPTAMGWTVTRTESAKSVGANSSVKRYAVEWSEKTPIRMRQLDERGARGRIIEFDAKYATQRSAEDSPPFALAPDEAMMLRALYVGQMQLLGGPEAIESESITHAGADALPLAWSIGTGARSPGVMELLRVPLGDGLTADYGFDEATGLLAAIRVEDGVSGATADATLFDYRDVGGVRWPTAIRTELRGRTYVDRLADVEVSR